MFLLSKIEWPSDADKFEAIGYLAKSGVIDAIEATVPADKLRKFKDEYCNKYSIEFPYVTKAGSKFGYQFRIYLSDTEGCPDFLATQLDEKYKNRKLWNQMSLVNIAKAGIFSADRSIREYG